jgi:hypothetical protein
MRLFRAVVLAAAIITTLAAADSVRIWTGADLKSASATLAPKAQAKSIAGKTLGAWVNQSASLWRRTKTGEAEMHKTKTDLIVIEQRWSLAVLFRMPMPPRRTRSAVSRFNMASRGNSRRVTSFEYRQAPRISSFWKRARKWPILQ